MRRLNNKLAVTQIVGFLLSIVIISMMSVGVLFLTDGLIDNKTKEAAITIGQDVADSVADAIIGTLNAKRNLMESRYEIELDVPATLAGRDYYIEIDASEVVVKSLDGSVEVSSTTLNAENFDYDISGKVIPSGRKVKIISEKTEYAYRFDFGTDDSISPIQTNYIRVTKDTKYHADGAEPTESDLLEFYPDWAYTDSGNTYYLNRMPITINNVVSSQESTRGIIPQDLIDYQFPIILHVDFPYDLISDNFDASRPTDNDIAFIDQQAFFDDKGVETPYTLPYWIEYWNENGVSKIWVKLTNRETKGAPYVEAEDERTFFMYFGAGVNGVNDFQDQSDESDIFEFFDDFSYPGPNDINFKTKWRLEKGMDNVVVGDEDYSFGEEDGVDYLQMKCDNELNKEGTGIISKKLLINKQPVIVDNYPDDENFVTYTNYHIETKFKLDNPTDAVDASIMAQAVGSGTPITNYNGFLAGTPIKLAGGGTKNIEDLNYNPADQILAPKHDLSGFEATDPNIIDNFIFGAEDLAASTYDYYIKITTASDEITVFPFTNFYVIPSGGTTPQVRTASYIMNNDPTYDFSIKIYNGASFIDVDITNVIPVDINDRDTYLVCSDQDPMSFGAYEFPGTMIAKNFVTFTAGYFTPEEYAAGTGYILSSYAVDDGQNGFELRKNKLTGGTDLCGSGEEFLDPDDWNLTRFGIFLARSYQNDGDPFTDPDPEDYLILGAVRRALDENGNPGGNASTLYRHMASSVEAEGDQNIYDVNDNNFDEASISSWDVDGVPIIIGYFGIGIGFVNPHVNEILKVDWIRVYQSLMYTIHSSYDFNTNGQSLLFGWQDTGPGYVLDTIQDDPVNNDLLRDFNYHDTQTNTFKVAGLDPGVYRVIVQTGDYNNPTKSKITINEENGLQEETLVTDINDATETPKFEESVFTVEISDNVLEVQFENDNSNAWTVCAIDIEKGSKSVNLELE